MTDLHPSLTAPESFARTTLTVDESGDWPPSPTVITHVLDGALAERVRRRVGAPADARVTLTETTIYGGYSAWTQENNTEFTVECDCRKVTFYPHKSTADWRDDAGKPWSDSVFARFDAWLAAAERPMELFDDWFEFEAESGNVVRYRARPDTILSRAATENTWMTASMTLTGDGDGYGRGWYLDLFAAPDEGGVAVKLRTFILDYASGMTVNPEVAEVIVTDLTDQLMLGTEW